MKSKLALLVLLITGFLTIFACTNPFVEKVVQIEEKPTPVPAVTYTVAFESGGGSPVDSRTVAEGGTATRPENPVKDDYIFHNWYADGELTMLFDFINTPITGNITVYAGWSGEEFVPRVPINHIFNVATTDKWEAAGGDIIDNGNDKNYVINVTADFSVTGGNAATFGDLSGVTVSLRGAGKTLTLNGKGSILRTGSDQNIITRNLTLRGHISNVGRLVYVNGGTFTMNGGKISGNNNPSGGGGVFVNSGGTFTMYGGEISGNAANNYGGGAVVDGGTFRIVTGTIYGSLEAGNVKNTAGSGGAALYRPSGTAQYGTFIEGEWDSNGNLNTTNDTIRVVNGVLEPHFTVLSANGSSALTTTALTLTFNRAFGLGADDIVLSGVDGVTGGQISGTGPTYTLPISGFDEGGTLSVSVSKDGYTVNGSPKTVDIYYSSINIQIEMELIYSGTFMMGSPEGEQGRQSNEDPHEVKITQAFYMGIYPVTQAQYEKVTGNNPSGYRVGGLRASYLGGITDTVNFPVEMVRWYEAIVFCNKLSMLEGLDPAYRIPGYNNSTDPADWGNVPENTNPTPWTAVHIVEGSNGYRLPTEAQWEYACRAGTETAYNWGTDTIDPSQANYTLERTSEAGDYEPNAWGLYDMHGNVSEWCWDWYDSDYYKDSPEEDPSGPGSGNRRIKRGKGNEGIYLRSAFRENDTPSSRCYTTGFRVVKPSD
jgi:uncharacterized repeat protein (TIGR02543 family)